MENYLRKELEAGKTVSIRIDVGYSAGGGVRPNDFIVIASINGKARPFEFKQWRGWNELSSRCLFFNCDEDV